MALITCPSSPSSPRLLAEINQHANGTGFRHGTFSVDFFEAVRKENHPHENSRGRSSRKCRPPHPVQRLLHPNLPQNSKTTGRSRCWERPQPNPSCCGAGSTPNRPDPSDFLGYAWKLLLQNHPHDDICGCSTDGVHEDDEGRFRQVSEDWPNPSLWNSLSPCWNKGCSPPEPTGTQSADLLRLQSQSVAGHPVASAPPSSLPIRGGKG